MQTEVLAQVSDAARSYVGTDMKPQGRVPGVGLDCVGVVVCAYRSAGLEPIDKLDYAWPPRRSDLVTGLERSFARVEGRPGAGDVVALKMTGSFPVHCGLYVGRGEIVHALRDTVVLDDLDRWSGRVEAIYRWRH